MLFQDPKPGRNRRKYKHGQRHYVKRLLKSRVSEQYSEQRATRQAGRLKLRQREARTGARARQAPMRPRWGRLERQSFRMAPLRAWLREREGEAWSAVKADLVALLNPSSHTGYAAYREMLHWVVWDENEDGPVPASHFTRSPFYVPLAQGRLERRGGKT